MKRFFNLSLAILCSVFFISNTLFAESNNDDFAANLHLYGATLESISPDDDGILDNKNIRIINLGPIVNHKGFDYAPTISADGRTLYYVSNRPGSVLTDKKDPSHDFWVAKKPDRMDTVFNQPFNLDPSNKMGLNGVNTKLNEGAASIAADNQTLYFTACDRPDGLGSCDIYKTSIDGDQWGRPVNLGKNVNSKNFDSQPSIAPDQSRIYFISTRKGPNSDGSEKRENFDIWYSDYDFELDEWEPAKNLTDLNTPGVEESPFIAADNMTMFFASDGHTPNLGGTDFYVARFDRASKKWGTPQNLGAPINTKDNEQFISLPASGDIIYFSSTRTDLPNYQGSLDVFMAFVPSFFKAVNLIATASDECSGEFIPATISFYNPITKKTHTDEVTKDKKEVQFIVTNDAYGDPAEDNQYINFEITAENPKYGKRTIVQRVDKPEQTSDQKEAGAVATEINVNITLGQRPVIKSEVEDGLYITENKSKVAELRNFNGLVMYEQLSWDLYPLLNYVFFDEGSAEFPDRYMLFDGPNDSYKRSFADTTVRGGTLDKYWHVLNIFGFRLTQRPEVKIELVGTNDGVTKTEKGNKELSKNRVENVRNYLRDVWDISEDRMKITVRDMPQHPSNPKDSLGIQENRRVEILCSEWEIIKPVFEKDPKVFPQPPTMKYVLENGIDDDLVASRRVEILKGGKPWKTLSDVGTVDEKTTWNWKSEDNKYPTDNDTYTAKLVVVTTSGSECESEPINIPILQVTSEIRRTESLADTLFENYSLILFKFNSSEAGPLNDKIMNDYVYSRCQPNSIIEIIGHTDVVGLYETNKKLSINRSKYVYNGISKQTKGKYASLKSDGVGEDDPLYTNDLPEGRFYNRTVQVLIKTPITD